ncbi:MAG: hypothetical protein ABEJ79_07250 [Halolamina sp.]
MVDIDSETLFNTAAAFVVTLAVGVFVVNLRWPHSPVSKYGLTLALLSGVVALTQRTDDRQLRLLGYAAVVVSGLVVFFELVNTFQLGEPALVVGLLVIAVALFGLRRRLDDRSRLVSDRVASLAFGALTAVAVAVLVVDVATGGLVYELQTEPTVEVSGDREPDARLGTLVVQNPTPLPERVDAPRYRACAAGNWSAYAPQDDGERRPVDAYLRVDDRYGDHVWSFGQTGYRVVVQLHGQDVTGETFPVETTDACPDDDSGDPYVAVFERENRRGPTPDAV